MWHSVTSMLQRNEERLAKATPAGGSEPPAGAQPDESVLDYLRNAPDELRPWADGKLAEFTSDAAVTDTGDDIDQGVGETATPQSVSVQDIASRAVDAGILEENDLALAELGEMDDDQQRAVRKARKRSRNQARLEPDVQSADSNARTNSAAYTSSQAVLEPKPKKTSKLFTILVVMALSLGLAFGVFMIGADDQKPLADNQLPDGHPDISQMQQPSAELEDYSERLFELEIAIRRNPDDWESRLEMGVLLMNQRDFEEAEEQWLVVLEGSEGHAEAYYNLGFLYTQKEPPQFDDAIEAWEALIKLDPDSELAQDVQPFYDTLVSGPPDSTTEDTP